MSFIQHNALQWTNIFFYIFKCMLGLSLTDCLAENELYKENAKMKRLLECRQDEVKAVYHEKALLDSFLTMSHKLEKHMTGMEIIQGNEPV